MTTKLEELVAVWPARVTVIGPLLDPEGTVAVMLVGELAVTTAVVPLNKTALFAGIASKSVPVMMIVAPTPPLAGEKPEMVGGGITVKLLELVPVRPAAVTVIGPLVAPAGTVVVILVAVLAVTVAIVPLNFTVLLAGVALKLVPAMMIVAPTPPLNGVKLVIVGCGITVKLDALVPVWPLRVTVMVPFVAPAGTVVVILVDELAVTTEAVPLNLTELVAGVVSKLAPEIVTVAPTPPLVGVKLEIKGGGITEKLDALVPVWPSRVTVIAPLVAPAGTVVVILVVVLAVTVAVVPLNLTVLLEGVVSKFAPVMVTVAPAPPVFGVKLEIVGGGVIAKEEALVAVWPATVTAIVPLVAPGGTVVVMPVDVLAETTATVPLNLTVLLAGVGSKLVPVIVTIVPTIPPPGEKFVITGTTIKFEELVPVSPDTVTATGPVVAPTGTVVVMV
jgi:hypothetical protein